MLYSENIFNGENPKKMIKVRICYYSTLNCDKIIEKPGKVKLLNLVSSRFVGLNLILSMEAFY